jgi:hypothetical protein
MLFTDPDTLRGYGYAGRGDAGHAHEEGEHSMAAAPRRIELSIGGMTCAAGAAMAFSSVFVVANSLRLRRFTTSAVGSVTSPRTRSRRGRRLSREKSRTAVGST